MATLTVDSRCGCGRLDDGNATPNDAALCERIRCIPIFYSAAPDVQGATFVKPVGMREFTNTVVQWEIFGCHSDGETGMKGNFYLFFDKILLYLKYNFKQIFLAFIFCKLFSMEFMKIIFLKIYK